MHDLMSLFKLIAKLASPVKTFANKVIISKPMNIILEN